jgi:hypothetical protein
MQKLVKGEKLGGRLEEDQTSQEVKLLTPPRLIRMQSVQKHEEPLK